MKINFDELPIDVQRYIRELRSESQGYRIERNKLRAEFEALRGGIDAGAA